MGTLRHRRKTAAKKKRKINGAFKAKSIFNLGASIK